MEAWLAKFHNPYAFADSDEMSEKSVVPSSVRRRALYFKTLQTPQAYFDFFIERFETPPRQREGQLENLQNDLSAGDTAISRERLEKLLDEALEIYKPHLDRHEWRKILDFCPKFLNEACRNAIVARQVADRLEALKLEMMPSEKIEFFRAAPDVIIEMLKRLLN